MSGSPAGPGLASRLSVNVATPRVPSSVWGAFLRTMVVGAPSSALPLLGGPLVALPDHVVAAGHAAVAADARAPFNGAEDLRHAIAAKLARENDVIVDPESEVMVTNGAMHALLSTLAAYVEPGVDVIMSGPNFFAHRQVELLGGKPIIVPPGPGMRMDIERLDDAITPATKVMILINPGNPTGVVATPAELLAVADLARRHDLVVVSDEAYEKFLYDGSSHTSLASLPEAAGRTLTIHSFTKSYALRGSRVGFVAGPQEILAPVMKSVEWSCLAVNPYSQAMACAALTGPQDWLRDAYASFDRNRLLLLDALGNSDEYELVSPQGGPFLYVRLCTGGSAEAFCKFVLCEYGLPVIPGPEFGHPAPEGDFYFRLPFGGEEADIRAAIEALDRGRAHG